MSQGRPEDLRETERIEALKQAGDKLARIHAPELCEEGRRQARIYGVSPGCAEIYGEGWAAGYAAGMAANAQPAITAEAECSCPRVDITTSGDLARGEIHTIAGYGPDCAIHGLNGTEPIYREVRH